MGKIIFSIINMAEENKIQDAQVESADSTQEQNEGKKWKKISSDLIMILIIGVLFGIAIKTEVAKRINVVDSSFYGKQGYDLAEMQKKIDEQNQSQVQEQAQTEAQPQPE